MKLIFQSQACNYIFDDFLKGWEESDVTDPKEMATKDYNDYMQNVYRDYVKYHKDLEIPGFYDQGCQEELCSWCNYHAYIKDICMDIQTGVVDRTNTRCKDTSCEECLSRTTWYKKL